ncbi:4-alpha-glucanotransferase [Nocardioides pantholopis]|uniref:4-alpha-glucanotransferase n=1 Tax=Nocardioides pantholopis TaxID=2483798 RepID=UPI000F08FAE7|nr:4-alpha-glucanotransferase [Nocardioides pantholopis]
MTDALSVPLAAPAADAWGLQQDWVDADDRPQRVPDATIERLREVIGTPPADLEDTAPIVTRPGRPLGLGDVTVRCEDGTTVSVSDTLPQDFPLGYHTLRDAAGRERRLIVSPGRCHVPTQQRWGWTVQLYGARSHRSWGIGDLADLRRLREWTEALGGGFLLVNPLHGVAPTLPQEASPYLPATRRFRNPVYLAVEDVPGVDEADLAPYAAELERLRGTELVDRDGAWRVKRPVLQAVFDRTGGGAEFAARRRDSAAVESWATWCALADRHGPDRLTWPEELRRADGPGVAAFVAEHAEEIRFHAWLQWLLDLQLRAATGELTVLQDLPIGVSGSGADAWAWTDALATGVTVGAPPDLLNSIGQDWGSPPLVPWRLRAADYEPFIESVRATIAGAGGLRIDHVMGLFRLWWIPEGTAPTEGAYVRYPADDLLDIVALESHRAGAVVVGEDLGTVEPGVREALAERGILSYKVLWFEDEDPAEWPEGALAAVTTHDLPTVAGLWTGSDVTDQLEATDMAEDDVRAGREDLLVRLRRDGLAADAEVPEAVEAAYRQLARAPSLLLSVALEDAVAEERRPNVPGTVERENWRIPLAVPLEELVADPRAERLARLVGDLTAR